MKIAFFGTPELTKVILDSLKENELMPSVIITALDRPQGRGLKVTPPPAKIWAKENNISCLQPEKIDADFMEELKKEKFDLFVVVAYGKILPEKLIDIPKYGTINVHYSLLPKYRGATPVESAILNGDEETGVSIQKMKFKLDTGHIIYSEKINIPANIKTPKLRDILNQKAAVILPDVIKKYANGAIIPVSQNENLASMSRKIKKEDGLIDPNGDPVINDRKFRAYFGSIGTHFFKEGKRVVIKAADFENGVFKIRRVVSEGGRERNF